MKIVNQVKIFISYDDYVKCFYHFALKPIEAKENREDIYFSVFPTKHANRILVKIRNAKFINSKTVYVRVTTYINSSEKLYALVEFMNTNEKAEVNYKIRNNTFCCKAKNIIQKINKEDIAYFINP